MQVVGGDTEASQEGGCRGRGPQLRVSVRYSSRGRCHVTRNLGSSGKMVGSQLWLYGMDMDYEIRSTHGSLGPRAFAFFM